MRSEPGVRRLRLSRLLGEALEGIRSQPTRSLLTGLGTLVGVGAVVVVLGVTATANAQIAETFSEQSSTLVTAELDPMAGMTRFDDDAEARVLAIDGVEAAGIVSAIALSDGPTVHPGGPEDGVDPPRVSGVTPGYFDVIDAPLVQGRVIDAYLVERPVAVLGARAAARLGIIDVAEQVLIQVGRQPFLVVGILGAARRDQVSAGDVLVPQSYIRDWLPAGDYVEQLLVTTRAGAGASTARQVPAAVAPFQPGGVVAQYPERPRVVDDAVSEDLRLLFVLLAVVSVVVAALGIANVALMSVMERRREIGLRRALGARRAHIVGQFLFEAAVLGSLGGAAGGAIGQIVVVVVSAQQSWTPTLDPALTVGSAPAGLVVGVVAGLYPAVRAASVPPLEALRSTT